LCLVCAAALVYAAPIQDEPVALLEEDVGATPKQRKAAIKSLEGLINTKAPTAAQIGAKVASKWQKKMNKMEKDLKVEIERFKKKADVAKSKEKIKLHAEMNAVKENAKKEIAKARAGGLSPRSKRIAANAAARVVNAESRAMHAEKLLVHTSKKASFAGAAAAVIRGLQAKLKSNSKTMTMLGKTLQTSSVKNKKLKQIIAGLKAGGKKKKKKSKKLTLLERIRKQKRLAKAAHHHAASLHARNSHYQHVRKHPHRAKRYHGKSQQATKAANKIHVNKRLQRAAVSGG
jgi:hypothetical protein